MKKLIFVFLVLLTLVIIAGCQSRSDEKKTAADNPSATVTTVTPLEEEKDPLPIGSAKADPSVEMKGPELSITSFEGETVETHQNYHVIRGTTPRNTAKVMVNDYTLHKYYPGQTQWSYIAATRIGTLAEGDNEYLVRAFDKEGEEIDSTTLALVYTLPVIPALPATGPRFWLTVLLTFIVSSLVFASRLPAGRQGRIFIR